MNAFVRILLAGGLVAATLAAARPRREAEPLSLGNFCLSLAVKDLQVSAAFYEKLGFEPVGGKLEQHWIVLRNGTTKIALFQGLIERNSLTFNPGWDPDRKTPEDFQDIRELQRILKERGVKLLTEADESGDGPASFTLADPDGNPILVDQYVPKPGH